MDLLPKGIYTLTLAPARMQQALSRAGDTHCNPATSKEKKRARDTKQAHAVQPWLAVVPLTAKPPHSGSPRLCSWAAFGGAQPCLHPPASPPKLSRGGEGRVGAAWMVGRAAFVRSWGCAGSGCACGSPPSPCKNGDYRAGEQQARLPPRLLHKSSSFQLTLSARQAAQGIMPEFARGEKKQIQRGFLKETAQGAQAHPLPAKQTQKMQHTTSPCQGAMGGRHTHVTHRGFCGCINSSSDSKHRPSTSGWSSVQQPVC